MTRSVELLSPAGSSIVVGSTSTLGFIVMEVSLSEVIFTFENGIPSTVIPGNEKVRVVVDVTKTVVRAPLAEDEVKVPYSRDVV